MPRATLLLLFLPVAVGFTSPQRSSAEGPGRPSAAARERRSGPVRVVDHSLTDRGGPFLGLGVSYFSALWRCGHDRARLESDLAFLSEQGFNYYRMLSMVGCYPAWQGREIAPVAFTSRDGPDVEGWPDYWEELRQLVDLAYDRYGLRTQVTIFADAQLMPRREDRLEHLRRLLSEVVTGRESKTILLEVANEGWQNGFAGPEGVAELREFAQYLADRTAVPVAITSNHEGSFADLYGGSAADVATWHFSRDRSVSDGWLPVYDCWRLGDLPGLPPVSSNEPIGPGASVASETESIRLVMAAAFAYAAKLPMYVFHSEAGVFGRTRFEDTPAIADFRHLRTILPGDLANWQRNDGDGEGAALTTFAGGQADRTWDAVPHATDGCVRMAQSRKGERFVCVPTGIRPGGLELEARTALGFRVYDPLTGKGAGAWVLRQGERCRLPAGAGGWLLVGRVRE
jgi:hypothetical protein